MAGDKIIYSLLFFPMIVYVGILTSYEDLKNKKIKNKQIFIGLIYSLAIYLFFFLIYVLITRRNTASTLGYFAFYLLANFDRWCINLAVSIVIAYLLWHFNMWGAGDAKLFICYSALIPLGQYSRVYFNYYFASFFLLISIFLPFTVYLFLKSTIYSIKKFNLTLCAKNSFEFMKTAFSRYNLKKFFKLFLDFMIFFLCFNSLRISFIEEGIFSSKKNLIIILFLAITKQLFRFLEKLNMFSKVLIILTLYLYCFEKQSTFNIFNSLILTIFIILTYVLFKKILDLYIDANVQKKIAFAPWIFLGVLITWFYK